MSRYASPGGGKAGWAAYKEEEDELLGAYRRLVNQLLKNKGKQGLLTRTFGRTDTQTHTCI